VAGDALRRRVAVQKMHIKRMEASQVVAEGAVATQEQKVADLLPHRLCAGTYAPPPPSRRLNASTNGPIFISFLSLLQFHFLAASSQTGTVAVADRRGHFK
jgi:hypothetical protein